MTPTKEPNALALRLFDLRNIIGLLLGIYGLLLTLAGLFPAMVSQRNMAEAADNPVDLAIGAQANLWVGLILLGVSAIFIGWAALRPVSREDAEAKLESPERKVSED